jgi:hypothetical protein
MKRGAYGLPIGYSGSAWHKHLLTMEPEHLLTMEPAHRAGAAP